MKKFQADKYLKLMVICLILIVIVAGEKRVLLVLKDNSTKTVRDLWNNAGLLSTADGFTGEYTGSVPLDTFLSKGDFRSEDIDRWSENSPYEIVVGAYNKYGDSLWTARFNSTGIGKDFDKLFSRNTYIGSSPVNIEPSMVNIGVSDNMFKMTVVCDDTLVWFQVSKESTGATIITSVDDLPHGVQEDYKVAFKLPKGGPLPSNFKTVYDLYQNTATLNEDNLKAACDVTAGSLIYKSSLMNEIEERGISKAKLVIYAQNIQKVALEFNTTGKDQMNWLDCNQILSSTYSDIRHYDKNYCSVTGHREIGRIFYINRKYNGCPGDEGWIMVRDTNCQNPCSYEPCVDTPYILYSGKSTVINWTVDSMVADALVIYLFDPKTNIGSDGKKDITFSGSFSLPHICKVNSSSFTTGTYIPLFIDGLSVMIDGDNNENAIFEMFYASDTCPVDFNKSQLRQFVTEDKVSNFPADGSRLMFQTIPFKCIWLFLNCDTAKDLRIYDVTIKLFYPEDKLMKVPYFVIEGIYTDTASTVDYTTSTNSEDHTTSTNSEDTDSTTRKSGDPNTSLTTTETESQSKVPSSPSTESILNSLGNMETTNGQITTSSAESSSKLSTSMETGVGYSTRMSRSTTVKGSPASAITSTVSSYNPTSSDQKRCTCRCYSQEKYANWENMTTKEKNEKIKEEVEKIKKELYVNKKQLSSNVRKKISASDKRPSAKYTGFIGLFLLCLVFGMIILPDVIQLLFYFKSRFVRYIQCIQ